MFLMSDIWITHVDQYILIENDNITIRGNNYNLYGFVNGYGGFIGNNNSGTGDSASGVGWNFAAVLDIKNFAQHTLSANSGYILRQNFGRFAFGAFIVNLVNYIQVNPTNAVIIGINFGENSTGDMKIGWCRNVGAITDGYGIAAPCSKNGTVYFENCTNYGSMENTTTSSFGITNFEWPRGSTVRFPNINTLLYRCTNYGKIKGVNSAGLCGIFTDKWAIGRTLGTFFIRECINYGEIVSADQPTPALTYGLDSNAGICRCFLGSVTSDDPIVSTTIIQNIMLQYCINTGNITGNGYASGLVSASQNRIVPGELVPPGFDETYNFYAYPKIRVIVRKSYSVISGNVITNSLLGISLNIGPYDSPANPGNPSTWVELTNSFFSAQNVDSPDAIIWQPPGENASLNDVN